MVGNNRYAVAVVILLLCLAVVPNGRAADTPSDLTHSTPEGILSFADVLLGGGESYRAATEYMRVLYHYGQQDEIARRALRGLGNSYARAGRWQEASLTFRDLHDRFPDPETRLMLGGTIYRAERNGEAAKVLLSPDEGSAPNEAERTLGTLAWLKMKPDPEAQPPSNAVTEAVKEYANLPRKSPTTAGLLSAVLPGSGHLYVDRPRDATVAFLINGLFIWGTVSAINQENWTLAAVLGGAEIFWYTGTLVGSVNAAHKWNRREEERFYQKWESGSMPRWAVWHNDDAWGLALGGRW